MKSMKKTEKLNGKKSDEEKNQEAAAGRVHAIAKARTTPETGKPTTVPEQAPVAVIVSDESAPSLPNTAATPGKPPKTAKAHAAKNTPPSEPDEIVVFAFRLTRSERDEVHAATGSAKASKFVKAIVLAGARGDMKAVQELIDGVHGSRK